MNILALVFMFLVSVGSIESQATVGQSTYECTNVGGVEEWTIYIDLKKKVAGFFDNDTTEVVPYKEMRFIETLPGQTEYVFERTARGHVRTRIVFNITRMTGYVVSHPGAGDEETYTAENGCRSVTGIVIGD